MKTYGVILAAGDSTRFDAEVNKLFYKVNGKELVLYPVETFLDNNEIDEVYKRISQCGELYYGEEFLNLNETDPDFEDLDYKKYMFTWDDRSVFTGLFSNFGFQILNCKDDGNTKELHK